MATKNLNENKGDFYIIQLISPNPRKRVKRFQQRAKAIAKKIYLPCARRKGGGINSLKPMNLGC